MKKWINLLLTIVCTLSLVACGNTQTATSSSGEESPDSIQFATESTAEQTPAYTEEAVSITLTIGDTVLDAYLNSSAPAQSLLEQLPLTVSLNDSDNDFCGDSIDIAYSESDVTSGYRNGDLAFWPPANNFVIFVSGEETSENTGDLVQLGHITSTQNMLDALEGQIDVVIALKEPDVSDAENTAPASSALVNTVPAAQTADTQEGEEMQIKITIGDTELYATLEDNATTRAWMEEMPMTLSMQDLYGREMCYRYGADTFPTDSLRYDGYAVGDIAYWPPRGSLVILYEQNGEQFERQHIGHIDSGVDIFSSTGDCDVTFDVVFE